MFRRLTLLGLVILAVLALIVPAAAQVGGIPEVARGTNTGAVDIVGLGAPAGANIFAGAGAGFGLPAGFGVGSGSGFSIFGPWGLWGPYDIFGPQGLFGYNGGLFGPAGIFFPNMFINGWWNGFC